jgi:type I restriction enzyme, S subunit
MSNLIKTKLKDLGYIKTGVKNYLKKKRYYSTGSIKGNIYTHEGQYSFANRPSRANREVKENDVLQARMQATDKCILASKDLENCLFSTGFFQFRPPRDKILSKYLYYFLSSKSFLELKDGLCEGSTQKAINDKSLLNIEIHLPNVSSQQKIISEIEKIFFEIDKNINLTNDRHKKTTNLFKQVLKKKFKDIDKKFPLKTLREISKIYGRGKSKHRPRNDKKLFGDKIPFIQTGDVTRANMYLTKYNLMYSEFGIKQSQVWEKETLCITIAANIAELAILNIDACFPDSIVGITPNKSLVTSEYLFYLLNYYQSEIKSESKGTAQQNINLATLDNKKFPIPDFDTQNIIVRKLNTIYLTCLNLDNLFQKKINYLNILKNLVLKKRMMI